VARQWRGSGAAGRDAGAGGGGAAAAAAAVWRRCGGGVARLVQVGDAQLVVLRVELEEDRVEAPGVRVRVRVRVELE